MFPLSGAANQQLPQPRNPHNQLMLAHAHPLPFALVHNQISSQHLPPSIARTAQHKSAGSAKSKLRQFADAETAYTAGVTCLPPGHLLLVPLYDNRALAWLRAGEYASAVQDAGWVLEIIGEGYHPARRRL
jgi:hypothetical protein